MHSSHVTAQELAHHNTSCWPEALGNESGRTKMLRKLHAMQRSISKLVYTSTWEERRWTPAGGSGVRHWNTSRDAAIFDGKSIVVLGASPMRNLALHFPAQVATPMYDKA